ncbi:MAG: hypothetical protein ACRDOI_43635 [Trebonia sp.]
MSVSAREAVLGSYPVLDGRESPFTAAVLLSWAVATFTGVSVQAAAGGGFGQAVMTGFLTGLLAAVSAAVARRAASRCRVVPLPYEACGVACAIEHASAVARAHTGVGDYDQDVTQSVRFILWEASGTDMSGAVLPLSRVLNAVLDRNRALLGPHASPAWYPAVSEDPARHPPAPERASEAAGFLAAVLPGGGGADPGTFPGWRIARGMRVRCGEGGNAHVQGMSADRAPGPAPRPAPAPRQQVQRIRQPIPDGIDVAKAHAKLVKLITEKHGEGWEIESIDPAKGEAVAVRTRMLTEITAGGSGDDVLEVTLPGNTRPSDGAKHAARLADAHPGYETTRFEPWLRRALLTRVDPLTSRARQAFSAALGWDQWEIQVSPPARPTTAGTRGSTWSFPGRTSLRGMTRS